MIDLIFGELIGKKCLVYIDDILVFGINIDIHDENLEEVVKILNKYGLEENKPKRVERKTKVNFLGYEIQKDVIKPLMVRAQGIIDFPVPRTKKHVQKFLGMINYDRSFIKNITETLKPLYKLLAKDSKFNWGEVENNAFNRIKNTMNENLELVMPDFDKEFVLETDTSEIGIGAALRQEGKPIAFASRTLSEIDKKYGITEREALAALWGMEKFQYYLTGKKFILVTDHKALEEIKNKAEFGSRRIQRWMERFEQFEFAVEYRKGSEIVVADTLSRYPKQSNTVICKLKNEESIKAIHERLNHRKNIYDEVYKVGISAKKAEIENLLKGCLVCNQKDKKREKSCKYVIVDEPGERVSFDMLEISPKERICVAIDYFSRKVWAKLFTSKESCKVVKFVKEVYKAFPFRVLMTDNGREFQNNEMKVWADENNVEHKFTVPHYHKSNGRVERVNRTLRTAIKKTKGSVRKVLGRVVENYNNLYHRGIMMAPNEAVKKENWNKVRSVHEKYKKEFDKKNKNEIKLCVGENVMMRNEEVKNKMDDEFHEIGIIEDCEGNDVYKIKTAKGNILRRHASQLKSLKRGDVGLKDQS